MRSDLDNWMSLTVIELNEIFSSIPSLWGIAGGWAIDLHIGKVNREHKDIDVVFFRENQQIFYNVLKKNWKLPLWVEIKTIDVRPKEVAVKLLSLFC
ncbi:hypothetical protein A8F94_00125 [Bacillus sp. FJAT-27225]|uniref:nucleotidyltransferase domain-containing protein n=1 Tax=Bacillus sp. FJAT-27225 TaxID=1743144 RepID=UPI00080C2DDC|nr:hypothetical protein [Bacillus sp. FJAT-27225]OCA90348.1 hypothetical protein A8F94_00125 [Bacillus sp. FJAT-27225]